MKFIKLTKWNGNHIYVNVDKIETIIPTEFCTLIEFNNGSVEVSETAEDIIAKIDKP